MNCGQTVKSWRMPRKLVLVCTTLCRFFTQHRRTSAKEKEDYDSDASDVSDTEFDSFLGTCQRRIHSKLVYLPLVKKKILQQKDFVMTPSLSHKEKHIYNSAWANQLVLIKDAYWNVCQCLLFWSDEINFLHLHNAAFKWYNVLLLYDVAECGILIFRELWSKYG